MFDLDGIVRTTAFFTRTSAPAFDPVGDGWWRQKYNARPLLRYTWREDLGRLLPKSTLRGMTRIRRKALRGFSRTSLEILTPNRCDGRGSGHGGGLRNRTVRFVSLGFGAPQGFQWMVAPRNGIRASGSEPLAGLGHLWRTSRYGFGFRTGGSHCAAGNPRAVDRLGSTRERNRFVSSGSIAASWLCVGGGISHRNEGQAGELSGPDQPVLALLRASAEVCRRAIKHPVVLQFPNGRVRGGSVPAKTATGPMLCNRIDAVAPRQDSRIGLGSR
jgi:hypothetical protein